MQRPIRPPSNRWPSRGAVPPLPHPSWGRPADLPRPAAALTASEFWTRLAL